MIIQQVEFLSIHKQNLQAEFVYRYNDFKIPLELFSYIKFAYKQINKVLDQYKYS